MAVIVVSAVLLVCAFAQTAQAAPAKPPRPAAVTTAAVAPCTYANYLCLPNGRFKAELPNNNGCTWNYHVDWADGQSTSFVLHAFTNRVVHHTYDTSRHRLYTIHVRISVRSAEPRWQCDPVHYKTPVEIPGPAVQPCVPVLKLFQPHCDPRGFKSNPLLDQFLHVTEATLDFLLLDDIRTLADPYASPLEKALIIASYLIPEEKIALLGEKALLRLAEKVGPRLLEALVKGDKAIVHACFARRAAVSAASKDCVRPFIKGVEGAVEDAMRTPAAQNAVTSALMKNADGSWIGKLDKGAQVLEQNANAAKNLFREVSRLGDTTVKKIPVNEGKTKKLFISALPNGDIVKYRAFSGSREVGQALGPTIQYFEKTTREWTTFHFKIR